MYPEPSPTQAALAPLSTSIPGVELWRCRRWLDAAESADLLRHLQAELDWTQHEVRLFGRRLPAPRLCCWIGDDGASYRYSGVKHTPLPWTAPLSSLRLRLQQTCAAPFNSVLANLYRNGQDSMGLHADDEVELGDQPVIASLSLGANRNMQFRARNGGERFDLTLEDGDLLVMRGHTQRHARHGVAKTRKPCGCRINLTFRQIFAPARGRPS